MPEQASMWPHSVYGTGHFSHRQVLMILLRNRQIHIAQLPLEVSYRTETPT